MRPAGWLPVFITLNSGVIRMPQSAAMNTHEPATVDANPYTWPYDGDIPFRRTALLNIDWQVDFCGKGGYVDAMGYDPSLTRTSLGPAQRVLHAARDVGLYIVHTREGHRPDLSELPLNKRWRSAQIGAETGSLGPCGRIVIRGEPGWDRPRTDPQDKRHHPPHLHGHHDGCVHTTMRDANDRGYECLVLSDCTGATDYANHVAALIMITMQGGVFWG